ncbi:hypothetical protein FQR65_LT11488 [Abscondita terminalis]|nr:hypothetical protein FQR65_LT11488 [Abscondita terminalis]
MHFLIKYRNVRCQNKQLDITELLSSKNESIRIVSTETNFLKIVKACLPANTIATQSSIWRQFSTFCDAKGYKFEPDTSLETLNVILQDWAFNMRKCNGEDYKEAVVKTIWNTTAKMLQSKYYKEFNVIFNPFTDIQFNSSRAARNAKRKILQAQPEKRKSSASALNKSEVFAMARLYDENQPEGLQRKLYHILAFELAWRGGEAAYCKTTFFVSEIENNGKLTGRIEYNPLFSKTRQGGNNKLCDSKWITPNISEEDICPSISYTKPFWKKKILKVGIKMYQLELMKFLNGLKALHNVLVSMSNVSKLQTTQSSGSS